MFRHPAVPVIALLLVTACTEAVPRGLMTGPPDPGTGSTSVPSASGAILVTPTTPVEGVLATFEATAPVTDPTAAYTWDFGDGTTAAGPVVEHAYALPGLYRVTLTVWAAGVVVETGELAVVVAPALADARPVR